VRYEELQLTFEPRGDDVFAVRLRSRVVGEAEGELRLPFAESELPAVFAALVPPDAARPGEPAPVVPMSAEEIGERLYAALFAGKLGERFAAAIEKIEGDAETGLRIELGFDLERPEILPLAALPWELLYHRDRRRFLALGAKTPVVRRIFMPRGVRPPLAPPLRLLTAWSDPKGQPLLDNIGESMTIERVLAEVPGLALSYLADPGLDQLRSVLRGDGEGAAQILHWIGHGKIDKQSGEGVLLFTGEERATRQVSGRILADYLQDCDDLRLIVLSACEGGCLPEGPGADPFAGVATALALAGVPAVIAMQMQVRDSAATAFVRALYTQLAQGLSLEAAVGEARLAVRAGKPTSAEFAVPVLFLRQGDLSLVEPAMGGAGTGASVRKELSEFRGLIEEKTRDFAGRRWLFERFDSFSQNTDSGYFLLRGDPGIGKTAVVAKLAQSRGYARYFNQRQSRNGTPGAFLRSLCAQLISAYGLARSLPPEAGESAQFLISLLDQIAERLPRGERAFFLVDALDEAESGAHSAGANLLYLPPLLPRGVFALVTARRGEIPLRAESIEWFDLDASSAENREDVREYLERAARRPGIAGYLSRRALSVEAFVAELLTKSEGNFMYLRYVLPELETERGALHEGEIGELPQGLANYYDDLWRRMKAADETAWYEAQLPVLAALTVAREPLPFEVIGELAGLSDRHRLRRVLEGWASFLSAVRPPDGGKLRYRLYHASFHDFVSAKDQVADERVRLGEMNRRFAALLQGRA